MSTQIQMDDLYWPVRKSETSQIMISAKKKSSHSTTQTQFFVEK